MLQIELETIPVEFWQTTVWDEDDTELVMWQFQCMNESWSVVYPTLGEAFAAAKIEIQDLLNHYGSFPIPLYQNDISWIQFDESF